MDNRLKSYTDEALLTELERRKSLRNVQPKAFEELDWRPIFDMAVDQINDCAKGKTLKDKEEYLWQEAVQMIYGKGIWEALKGKI